MLYYNVCDGAMCVTTRNIPVWKNSVSYFVTGLVAAIAFMNGVIGVAIAGS